MLEDAITLIFKINIIYKIQGSKGNNFIERTEKIVLMHPKLLLVVI